VTEGLAERPERLVVALVRGVHGLRGAVRVEILTDRPEERFVPGAVLFREGDDEPLHLESADAVADGPGWRLRFREVPSREAADTLRGAYLEVDVRPHADLARGEVYWHEVMGVTVRGLDDTELGTVTDIYRVAENEVYVVTGGPFGTFDLPAVRAFIRIFAPRRGEIVVDADALDLRPPKASRADDPDRPRAPRRTSRKGKAGSAPTEAAQQASVRAAGEDPPATAPASPGTEAHSSGTEAASPGMEAASPGTEAAAPDEP
jgi:16S rRNA processing protein RimM